MLSFFGGCQTESDREGAFVESKKGCATQCRLHALFTGEAIQCNYGIT